MIVLALLAGCGAKLGGVWGAVLGAALALSIERHT